jgi:hypothetical protein
MRSEPREWDWLPPRRPVRRPRPIYIEHERPQRTSWWATPAGRMVGHTMFFVGVGVWKIIIVGALMVMMSFAALVLVGLARATIG